MKTPEQQATKLARRLLPEIQHHRGGIVLSPVSNHTDADQRHMVRSGEKNTIRKLTRIEKLHKAGTLNKDEALACQWYADAHALGYDTLGITANYMGAGGRSGSSNVVGHLSRYKAQQEARADYSFAREALANEKVPGFIVHIFERVILEGLSLNTAGQGSYMHLGRSQRAAKLTAIVRMAANLLHGRIAHRLPVE